MMMSRAVQQLMWFELLFQTQGHVLPSWTEWIIGARDLPAAAVVHLLPLRVSCPRQCAMPVQLARGPEQAQGHTSPTKNRCDKQVSSWRHISCHTDKNRYYT